MRREIIYFLIFLALFIALGFKMQNKKTYTYLPLGDSYTICTGAKAEQSWPVILTKHLNEKGIHCILPDNPARNGYTTQNLIDFELPLLKKYKPEFVTLLIGVNDWVQNVAQADFEKNYKYILDEIQKTLPEKTHVLLITIPDFGVTPQGKKYAYGRNIRQGISEFNAFIKLEAKTRGLELVDVFEETQKMEQDDSLIAGDGLHPSAKEYEIWERMILPKALSILNKKGDR